MSFFVMKNRRLEKAAAVLLYSYLISYAAFPYTTKFSPYSLHSTVLFLGFIITTVLVWKRWHFGEKRMPQDLFFFFAVLVTFIVSAFIVNVSRSSSAGLRAYLASFLCFLFVRFSADSSDRRIFFLIFYIYLIASGIIILFQIYGWESFYISNHLTSGKVRSVYGVGLANFNNLGGALILWPLSIVIAKLSAEETRKKIENILGWSSVILGTLGLYFTFSRASWLGIFAALLIIWLILFFTKRPLGRIRNLTISVVAVFILGYLMPTPVDYYKKSRLVADDYSARTRLITLNVSLSVIAEAPLFGIGVGRFPEKYLRNYTILSAKDRMQIDPREKINTHNAYLELAVEAGLLTATTFLLFAGYVIKESARGFMKPSYPFLIGLVSLSLWMIFHDLLKERLFWIALAITPAFQKNE